MQRKSEIKLSDLTSRQHYFSHKKISEPLKVSEYLNYDLSFSKNKKKPQNKNSIERIVSK